MNKVYLDHAATTPLDPRVFEVMLPFLKEDFGNASSVHALGRKARHAVEACREKVAGYLGAEPGEIVFTSGGTEADNLALKGVLLERGGHLITSAAEHKAVLTPAQAWMQRGGKATILRPATTGAITPQQLEAALTEDTSLVSLMHANNELGSLTPIPAISEVCRAHDVLLHCDAVQTAGLFRLNVQVLGVDLLTLSGHKFYGPKGAGVLYVRGGVTLSPLVEGGGQERGRRGGTENVAAIVGLTTAFELAMEEANERVLHLTRLRDRLCRLLREALGDKYVSNTPLDGDAAPHILNLSFLPVDGEPLDGEMLLLNLDLEGVMVSAGSACTSGTLEPSHVLLAIGRDRAVAAATLRFSFGKDNTEADVDYTAGKLEKVLRRMGASISP